MKSLGWLRKDVVSWIEDYEGANTQNSAINRAISIVCGNNFQQLYKSKDITPSDAGNFYLPARCQDVLDIHPITDGYVSDGQFHGARRMPGPVRRDLSIARCVGSREINGLEGVELTLSTGSSSATVSTGTISDSYVGGEFILVDGIEKYEITSVVDDEISFYPEFRWSDTTAEIIVNPAGTPIYRVFSSDGTPYTDDVTVEYFKLHPYLVRDRDMLLIPAPNTVVLEAVKLLLRSAKYDVDAVRLEQDLIYYRSVEYNKNQPKDDVNLMIRDTLFSVHNNHRR